MKTYNEYKDIKKQQDLIVDALSDRLNLFPKGELGMTIVTDEFKTVNAQFKKEFMVLQNIHSMGMKLFKKEIRKELLEKRKNKTL